MSDLTTWREEQRPKVTQAILAKRLNIKQPHLSAIENGEKKVSLELAIRIFLETGVRVGKLRNATPRQALVLAKIALGGE